MQQTSPSICGRESELQTLMLKNRKQHRSNRENENQNIKSCFACALHMHQPTIPAGANKELISHLQYMFEHSNEGDNHNASSFAHCYRRLADLIPELINEGCQPKIMLDYSGNLLWGFEQMQRNDIIGALQYLALDKAMQDHVEWLGTFWGHAVAPSTPIPDFQLQISAWQHQFASMFGTEALERVHGFSLPEMHLPNHPDTLFELIKSLKNAGYSWLLVQEDSIEQCNGHTISYEQKYLPNQLISQNSQGDQIEITVLIKTQGSDTKLVGQMQPYYEAIGLDQQTIENITIPSMVTQIADGENGGVMMNEFPDAFRQAHQRIKDSSNKTVAMNGTEYIELIASKGISTKSLPKVQAIHQHALWNAVGPQPSRDVVERAIKSLRDDAENFSMHGASWTNNISWVEGYENILDPMNQLSRDFHKKFDSQGPNSSITTSTEYQQALLHLLVLETSCFRYWGQGQWTDYASEIQRRGNELLKQA